MKRGEIYFVTIPASTGAEMQKTRPAVCISADALNQTGACPLFAFCSAKPQDERPTHVTIRTTPVPSTVLCEHVYAVDPSRIENCIGKCTPDELSRIDIALASAFALEPAASPVTLTAPAAEPIEELLTLRGELRAWRQMVRELLSRDTGGAV